MNIFVKMHHLILVFAVCFVLALCGVGVCQTIDYGKLSREELQNKIASFELGFDSYIIGKKLSAAQQLISKKDAAYKAYPGTLKFKDRDVFVIIDEKSDVVIAVYKRNKSADKNVFKALIGELMMQYGEPTAEAHGNTVYWNYSEDGLISDELYRAVKKQGKLADLIVLATVKFSSTKTVANMTSPVALDDKVEEKKAKGAEEKQTSDLYVMIQSDMLTKKYMNQ